MVVPSVVPFFSRYPNVAWWILAWTDGVRIWVRRPFHRIFFAPQRISHEHWHIRDMTREHHPWYHFCIAVGHALRLRWIHDT